MIHFYRGLKHLVPEVHTLRWKNANWLLYRTYNALEKRGDVLRGKRSVNLEIKISGGLARHAERVLEPRPFLALLWIIIYFCTNPYMVVSSTKYIFDRVFKLLISCCIQTNYVEFCAVRPIPVFFFFFFLNVVNPVLARSTVWREWERGGGVTLTVNILLS